MWSRTFFRPSFHFRDPFEEDPFFFPMWDRPLAIIEDTRPVAQNPHDTFNRFFDQNPINEEEKAFFQKHFPEKVPEQFDPYKCLGVPEKATLDEIKKAYRAEALKCHPKADQTPQAKKRFFDLGRAYQMLVNNRIIDSYKNNSIHDFFNDFEKTVEKSFKPEMEIEEGKDNKKWKDADFYSESTYVETKNGDKKALIEREYKKDGKTVKYKREEKFLPDGTKEVTEETDEGQGVQKKHFIENQEGQKQIKQ